jgi:hypothetical protein
MRFAAPPGPTVVGAPTPGPADAADPGTAEPEGAPGEKEEKEEKDEF